VCSHSITELEPRLFSFNSPYGRLPELRWHGPAWTSSTRRGWWHFPALSLASGAIKGWDRRNAYYFAMLESLAKHYKFRHRRPVRDPAAGGAVTAVLHGSGDEEIKFSYVMDSGASQRQEAHQKAPVRGHPAQHGAALPRDRFGGGA
jgi:excinuclease ABC subunit A